MAVNEIMASKVRKYIKQLRRKNEKYSPNEAFKMISRQIQKDEALRKEEMDIINEDIMARLKENWPFKNIIK